MKTIPTTIQTYAEGSKEPLVTQKDTMVYEPIAGEKIIVTLWVQYPSYDFIFGTPAPDNPKYKDEYGYFCFRRDKEGRKSFFSVYVDQCELEEMQKGWVELAAVSRIQRGNDWQEYDKNLRG